MTAVKYSSTVGKSHSGYSEMTEVDVRSNDSDAAVHGFLVNLLCVVCLVFQYVL